MMEATDAYTISTAGDASTMSVHNDSASPLSITADICLLDISSSATGHLDEILSRIIESEISRNIRTA